MEKKVKKNMGTIDRVVRFLVAVLIAILYFTDQISGIAAIILGLFAVVFLITSFMSSCPLYMPFKFSTIKKNNKN
jgi:Na+(H+)/acetate symporter ActP